MICAYGEVRRRDEVTWAMELSVNAVASCSPMMLSRSGVSELSKVALIFWIAVWRGDCRRVCLVISAINLSLGGWLRKCFR